MSILRTWTNICNSNRISFITKCHCNTSWYYSKGLTLQKTTELWCGSETLLLSFLAHVLLKLKRFTLSQTNKYVLIFDNYSGPKVCTGIRQPWRGWWKSKTRLKTILPRCPWYQKTNSSPESLELLFGITNIQVIEEGCKSKGAKSLCCSKVHYAIREL